MPLDLATVLRRLAFLSGHWELRWRGSLRREGFRFFCWPLVEIDLARDLVFFSKETWSEDSWALEEGEASLATSVAFQLEGVS